MKALPQEAPGADQFAQLAAGAALCAQFAGSFVLFCDGKADDTFDTLEEAADAYVDSWADWDSLAVREYAPSGASADVTAEARAAVEAWLADRGDVAPWDRDGEFDDEESEYDFQRSQARIAGHFA